MSVFLHFCITLTAVNIANIEAVRTFHCVRSSNNCVEQCFTFFVFPWPKEWGFAGHDMMPNTFSIGRPFNYMLAVRLQNIRTRSSSGSCTRLCPVDRFRSLFKSGSDWKHHHQKIVLHDRRRRRTICRIFDLIVQCNKVNNRFSQWSRYLLFGPNDLFGCRKQFMKKKDFFPVIAILNLWNRKTYFVRLIIFFSFALKIATVCNSSWRVWTAHKCCVAVRHTLAFVATFCVRVCLRVLQPYIIFLLLRVEVDVEEKRLSYKMYVICVKNILRFDLRNSKTQNN